MHYRIVHHGVPIGEVELDLANDPAVGAVAPLLAYEAIRHRVQAATRAFRTTVSQDRSAVPSNSEALADGAALGRELELRDDREQLMKTDFIELADWEGQPLDVTVWVRARGALSGIPSPRAPFESSGDRSEGLPDDR